MKRLLLFSAAVLLSPTLQAQDGEPILVEREVAFGGRGEDALFPVQRLQSDGTFYPSGQLLPSDTADGSVWDCGSQECELLTLSSTTHTFDAAGGAHVAVWPREDEDLVVFTTSDPESPLLVAWRIGDGPEQLADIAVETTSDGQLTHIWVEQSGYGGLQSTDYHQVGLVFDGSEVTLTFGPYNSRCRLRLLHDTFDEDAEDPCGSGEDYNCWHEIDSAFEIEPNTVTVQDIDRQSRSLRWYEFVYDSASGEFDLSDSGQRRWPGLNGCECEEDDF